MDGRMLTKVLVGENDKTVEFICQDNRCLYNIERHKNKE